MGIIGKGIKNETEYIIILCYILLFHYSIALFPHFEYCIALFRLEKDALGCKRNDWDIGLHNNKWQGKYE